MVKARNVPEGAVFKGYQSHTVDNVVFHAERVTYKREVWQLTDGCPHHDDAE